MRKRRAAGSLLFATLVGLLTVPTTVAVAAPPNRPILGSAVRDSALNVDVPYTNMLASHYRMVSPENAANWNVIEPARGEFNFAPLDRLVDFATAHGQVVQGMPLLFWAAIPPWVVAGNFGRDEFISILQDYIQTVVSRYAGRVAIWDVANEAVDWVGNLHHNLFYQHIGPDYLDIAYRAARAADPTAKLYYNDVGGEVPSGKQTGALAIVAGFRARGVPLDGVGLQMHTTITKSKALQPLGAFFNPPSAKAFATTLRTYQQLGLEVAITEMDVRLAPPITKGKLNQQANVYRLVRDACVVAPNCMSLTTWGFTDRYSWIPNWTGGAQGWALPFDSNLAPKRAAKILFG